MHSLKGTLGDAVRRSAWCSALLDGVPVEAEFADGLRRSLRRRVASLFATARKHPDFWLESRCVYEAYQGGDFLDVGAFFGWYSLMLSPKARPGDTLVSFEPSARAFPDTLRTVSEIKRLFPALTLHALNLAVGQDGASTATYPLGRDSHPSFVPGAGEGTARSVSVDAVVSALGLTPRLIKVDVEGAELFVLRGMERTIRAHRPTLFLEVHPDWMPAGCSDRDVYAILASWGYQQERLDDRHGIWRP